MKMKNYLIEKRLKIIKLLILIRYLYKLQKAQRLLALCFEAGEDEIRTMDGNIVERYKYNIYGSPTITDNTGNILSESAIGNDYLFQSRRYDKELHLYYYRARTYDPQIGRFLQTDPIGYKDSMNLYQAMNMNPWGFVDPWGDEYFIFSSGKYNTTKVTIYENRDDYLKSKNPIISFNLTDFMKRSHDIDMLHMSKDEENKLYYSIMISERNLQSMSYTQQKKIEFLDRLGGESEGYNATAHVYNSRGNGEIEYETFDARTYPGNVRRGDLRHRYATIKNGTYWGKYQKHKGKYGALRLCVDKNCKNEKIPTVGGNPYAPWQYLSVDYEWGFENDMLKLKINNIQGYATTINIHKFSLSWGCLMINEKQWDYFWRIMDIKKDEKGVKIIVDTKKNK